MGRTVTFVGYRVGWGGEGGGGGGGVFVSIRRYWEVYGGEGGIGGVYGGYWGVFFLLTPYFALGNMVPGWGLAGLI